MLSDIVHVDLGKLHLYSRATEHHTIDRQHPNPLVVVEALALEVEFHKQRPPGVP